MAGKRLRFLEQFFILNYNQDSQLFVIWFLSEEFRFRRGSSRGVTFWNWSWSWTERGCQSLLVSGASRSDENLSQGWRTWKICGNWWGSRPPKCTTRHNHRQQPVQSPLRWTRILGFSANQTAPPAAEGSGWLTISKAQIRLPSGKGTRQPDTWTPHKGRRDGGRSQSRSSRDDIGAGACWRPSWII